MAPQEMALWFAADEGEKRIKKLFPRLRTPAGGSAYWYTGWVIHTTSIRTTSDNNEIGFTLYKYNADKDAIKQYDEVLVQVEPINVFPSDHLIAQLALLVG